MIEFKDDDIFQSCQDRKNIKALWPKGPNGTMYLNRLDCSIGIIAQCDEVMTQIYWQDGKWEWFHTFDLNTAANVEIL